MRAIVQRSQESSVTVLGKVVGSIKSGLVVLVGFTQDDTIKDIEYIVDKIINLRIFDGTPELSVKDLNGEILAISQFTLYANAKKGRRPSYIEALKNTEAIELYNIFIDKLKESNLKIATGIFGADMLVNIKNDGPFTIILDSKN
ncbi:MAG: D-aminoacyl-tRNA deacylase [Erysipelotrichaceae bacterium]|nr:D-aminoacyl-tRNA deacylase [Erysipelotrichaceae bacterium]